MLDMSNVYCTILSKYRVYQGIVLYRSLLFNTERSKLYILCVDGESFDICSKMNLDDAILIRVMDLRNEQLVSIKSMRDLNEYCWTLKPYLIEYVLNQPKSGICVTYVDADICFFNDPSIIYKKNKEFDVMLSEHDYSDAYKGVEALCGKYNSGFIVFRNTKNAVKILKWWQERCMEWCHDTLDGGRFGDQKYLDSIPGIFKNVCSINIPGVNIAPWNEQKYTFTVVDQKVNVDRDLLICYHFSGFRVVEKNKVALIVGSKKLYNLLHFPYIKVLKGVIEDVEKVAPLFNGFNIEQKFSNAANYFDI